MLASEAAIDLHSSKTGKLLDSLRKVWERIRGSRRKVWETKKVLVHVFNAAAAAPAARFAPLDHACPEKFHHSLDKPRGIIFRINAPFVCLVYIVQV